MSGGGGGDPGDIPRYEELIEVIQQSADEADRAAAAYERMSQTLSSSSMKAEYFAKANEQNVKAMEASIQATQLMIEALAEQGQETAELEQKLAAYEARLKSLKGETEAVNALNQGAKDGFRSLAGMIGMSTDSSQNFVYQLGLMTNSLVANRKELIQAPAIFNGFASAMNSAASWIEQGFIVLLKKGIDIVLDMNSAQMTFNRTMGIAESQQQQYADSIKRTSNSLLLAGVSVRESGEAWNQLYTSVTRFSHMTTGMQEDLMRTTALLERNGMAAQQTTQSVEMLSRVYGMTGTEAAKQMRNLRDFAEAARIPPEIISRDFAEASRQLAVHGKRMVSVFKDLELAAKGTGIGIQQLLSITSRFDTFEGAAEAAGRLNAILGRDLFNSLDMLMTVDPTERFRRLRQGILQAAGSFEQLSYYEKRAIADAAGLEDVAQLAMLMSGRLEQSAGAMGQNAMTADELARRTENLASLQEKFANTLSALAPQFHAFMDWLVNMTSNTKEFKEWIESWIQTGIKWYGGLKIGAAILSLYRLRLMAVTAAAGQATMATRGLSLAMVGAGGLGVMGLMWATKKVNEAFNEPGSPTFLQSLGIIGREAGKSATPLRGLASSMGQIGAQAGAMQVASNLSMALRSLEQVDSTGIRGMAAAIRDVASAMNDIDPNKSLEFRATIQTFGTSQIAQAVAAANSLRDSDVNRIKDLVTQANELAAASRTSEGDQLNALVRSVAQLAQVQAGAGAAGGGYAGPSKVESVLKLDGRTLDRHIVNVVSRRFGSRER